MTDTTRISNPLGRFFRAAWVFANSRLAIGIADQAIVSGASFLTGVAIGKMAGDEMLGGYSLAISFAILAYALSDALVSEPFTLRRQKSASRSQQFAGSVLLHQVTMSSIVSGGLLAAALVAATVSGITTIAPATFLVLACVVPAFLLRQFARRFEFAFERPIRALAVDSTVALIQGAGFFWLIWRDAISIESSLLVIAIANGAASGIWLLFYRSHFEPSWKVISDWRDNFMVGRWLAANALLSVVGADIAIWITAFCYGRAQAGVLVACFTISTLMNPILLGLQNILQPRCVQLAEDGRAAVRAEVVGKTFLLAGLMAVYFLAAWFAGGWFIGMVYGEAFMGNGLVVALIAAQATFMAVAIPSGCGLNALGRTDSLFWARTLRISVSAVVSIPLVYWQGIVGAATALLIGAACGSLFQMTRFLAVSLLDMQCDKKLAVREGEPA